MASGCADRLPWKLAHRSAPDARSANSNATVRGELPHDLAVWQGLLEFLDLLGRNVRVVELDPPQFSQSQEGRYVPNLRAAEPKRCELLQSRERRQVIDLGAAEIQGRQFLQS
jgi:hypothetical protein